VRIRSLQVEAADIADGISVELYQAGRDGRESGPVVGELRDKARVLEAALVDLRRVEEGADAAVVDAQNGVQDSRFRAAPILQQQLEERAAALSIERARLEAELAQVANREQDVRAAWRELGATIPGYGEAEFADGVHTPVRVPTAPHAAISAYARQADWPAWFAQTVREAVDQYGDDRQRAAYGLTTRRSGVPELAGGSR
jgi:hypothetical protein